MVSQIRKLKYAMGKFKIALIFECVDLLHSLARLMIKKGEQILDSLEEDLKQEMKEYENV